MKSQQMALAVVCVACAAALTGCTTSPHQTMTPDGRPVPLPSFYSVQMVNSDTGWEVAAARSLWLTTSGARSWKRISFPGVPHSPVSLVIDPLGTSTAWVAASSIAAASDHGGLVLLFRTTDGGQRWSAMPKPFGGVGLPLVGSLDFLNSNDGWVILQAPHGMGSSPGVLYRPTCNDPTPGRATDVHVAAGRMAGR